MTHDTIMIATLSDLDLLAEAVSARLDYLDGIHPNWADWCEDGADDLLLHDELSEAVDLYYSIADQVAPYRPLYTCALVTYGRYCVRYDYTVGY